jgi:hypothetical protein
MMILYGVFTQLKCYLAFTQRTASTLAIRYQNNNTVPRLTPKSSLSVGRYHPAGPFEKDHVVHVGHRTEVVLFYLEDWKASISKTFSKMHVSSEPEVSEAEYPQKSALFCCLDGTWRDFVGVPKSAASVSNSAADYSFRSDWGLRRYSCRFSRFG